MLSIRIFKNIIMPTLWLLSLNLFTIGIAFSGPACDWKPIKTEITKSDGYSLEIVTLDCNIQYYKGQNITAQRASILDFENNVVANQLGNWGSNNENYPDEISLVKTPDKFPHIVILTSVYGASNISHTYHIYSTSPMFKKIGKVVQPVNKYQASKGNGSEKSVVGIYLYKRMFLIDRLTTKGTEIAKCNSCQALNVETLRITNSKLISLGLREYNQNTYTKYIDKKNLPISSIDYKEAEFLEKLFSLFIKNKEE